MAVAQSIGHEAPGIAGIAKLAAGTAARRRSRAGAHIYQRRGGGRGDRWLSERVASWAIDAGERFAEARRDGKARGGGVSAPELSYSATAYSAWCDRI